MDTLGRRAGRIRPTFLRHAIAVGLCLVLASTTSAEDPVDKTKGKGPTETVPKAEDPVDKTKGKGPTETALDLTKLSLEELMNVEIEVVTASKQPEPMWEAPAAVYVISHDDIVHYGYRNLADALRQIAGLYVSSDRNYEYLGVRGYARPGDYNTRILLLVDGHRINDPIFDQAYIGEDFSLDIQSVQQIEVVKGPGAALWGTNALLAVINVITRKGSDIGGTTVIGEYGSQDWKKGFIEYGKAFDSGLELAASYSILGSNGQHSIFYQAFDDPSTNNGYAVDVDSVNAMRGYLRASYRGFNLLFDAGKRRKAMPPGSWETVFSEHDDFTFEQRDFTELNYERIVLPKVNGNLLLRLYTDHTYYHGDFTLDPNPNPTVNVDMAESKWWGSEARYSQDITSRLSAILGAEYIRVFMMKQENHDVNPYFQYSDVSSSYTLSSFYLQTEYQALKALRVTAGIRLDDYSTFGPAWSPRAAVIYAPTKVTTLKLLYGKAFRAPGAYERDIYFPGLYIPNPNLGPERIETSELVWQQILGRQSRLQVSFFRFLLSDIITLVETPSGDLQFQNLGGVRSDGVEAQVESRSDNGTTNFIGVALTRAVDATTGDSISNSPQWVVSGGMSIPVWSGRAYISPAVRYMGSRYTLTGNKANSPIVFDLTLGTTKIAGNLDVSLSLYNVFNATVFVPGSADFIQDAIPQNCRTMRVQAAYHF